MLRLPLLQRHACVGGNPANDSDPMGLCGSLSGCAGAAWNNLKDNLDKAGSLIADCIGSDTCTKMVGQGLFLAGAFMGNPIVMAVGIGVMAGVDAPDCAGGSAMGCVNLALDAAVLGGVGAGVLGDAVAAEAGEVEAPASARSQYGRVSSMERAAALENSPTCPYCGVSPSTQVDHITSLKQDWDTGGWMDDAVTRTARVNDPSNLTGACRSCNASKGARPSGAGPGEWWPKGWPGGVRWPLE